MSTSTYYSFISGAASAAANHTKGPISIKTGPHHEANQIDLHRQTAISPSSYTTSSSNSSSSLNSQFNSLTPNSATSSSSASSTASTSNLVTTTLASVASTRHPVTLFNRELVRQSSSMATSQTVHHQLHHSYTLHSLEPKPLKPFKSQNAYIEAMKEDLAEWLNQIYADLELTPENLFSQLETGAIICRHANNVTQMGRNIMIEQAATNSDAASSGSDNENSLNHEQTIMSHTTLSSPSPDGHESVDHHQEDRTKFNNQNQFYRRHRHSTTNSSISSITTTCSSTSKQRRSLTGSSIGSPRSDRTIDWFRVKLLTYKSDAQPGTFFARDNICQFILWCRSLNILECLLFETDDLVARKNEKSFILCLLEVARIGFKVGMPTPLIIQLEQEIDREIENDAKLQKHLEEEQQECANERRRQNNDCHEQIYTHEVEDNVDSNDSTHVTDFGVAELAQQVDKQLGPCQGAGQATKADSSAVDNEKVVQEDCEALEKEDSLCDEDFGPKPQVITNDLLSLHERVVQLLCQCTCPTQFPMVRIGDGKYKVGDKLIIFVRILRRHIMVRVGGGWQELSEFLRQKDPCRTKSPNQSHFNQQQSVTIVASANKLFATHTPATTLTMIHNNGTTTTNNNANTTTSIPVSRARLLGSGHHLNKGYSPANHRHSPSGHRLISGSASMSWLSHNS